MSVVIVEEGEGLALTLQLEKLQKGRRRRHKVWKCGRCWTI